MRCTRAVLWTCVLAAGAVPASADERKFTYSYEAKTLPEGSWEFEQWITLRARREAGAFRHWDLREEVEYGLTDRLNTALYLNLTYKANRDVPGLPNEHELEFEGVSSEWKYKLTDPSVDPVGALLYGELTAGQEDEIELEFKGVFSREVGPFTFAYNFVFEIERARETQPSGRKKWETEFGVAHTLGASYAILSGLGVGVEALAVVPLDEDFSRAGQNVYFLGPNAHVAMGPWWATLTFLLQVGDKDLDSHELYEVRLMVGVNF